MAAALPRTGFPLPDMVLFFNWMQHLLSTSIYVSVKGLITEQDFITKEDIKVY
jgi:hypothetical protein